MKSSSSEAQRGAHKKSPSTDAHKGISTQATSTEAISLLLADHNNVKSLFEKFESLSDRSKVSKKKIAHQICHELIAHTRIEEEIFYPAVREAIKDDALT